MSFLQEGFWMTYIILELMKRYKSKSSKLNVIAHHHNLFEHFSVLVKDHNHRWKFKDVQHPTSNSRISRNASVSTDER